MYILIFNFFNIKKITYSNVSINQENNNSDYEIVEEFNRQAPLFFDQVKFKNN